MLDTACARVAIGQGATPSAVEDSERRIVQLTVEMDALQRESVTGTDHRERIEELKIAKASEEERHTLLKEQWNKERAVIDQIRDIRTQLEAHVVKAERDPAGAGNNGHAGATPAAQLHATAPKATGFAQVLPAAGTTQVVGIDVDALRSRLIQLNEELEEIQGETPLMQPHVNSQMIAEVISGWTGIPVGKMMTDEINSVLALPERLAPKVVRTARTTSRSVATATPTGSVSS